MKTLKYFPLFILLSFSSYSQNIIDPPVLPIGFDSTALFERNFNDTTFIRGWHWGSLESCSIFSGREVPKLGIILKRFNVYRKEKRNNCTKVPTSKRSNLHTYN